jgi:hypothetical protein
LRLAKKTKIKFCGKAPPAGYHGVMAHKILKKIRKGKKIKQKDLVEEVFEHLFTPRKALKKANKEIKKANKRLRKFEKLFEEHGSEDKDQ